MKRAVPLPDLPARHGSPPFEPSALRTLGRSPFRESGASPGRCRGSLPVVRRCRGYRLLLRRRPGHPHQPPLAPRHQPWRRRQSGPRQQRPRRRAAHRLRRPQRPRLRAPPEVPGRCRVCRPEDSGQRRRRCRDHHLAVRLPLVVLTDLSVSHHGSGTGPKGLVPFFHKVPPTREKTPDLGGSGAFRIKRDQFLGFLPFE